MIIKWEEEKNSLSVRLYHIAWFHSTLPQLRPLLNAIYSSKLYTLHPKYNNEVVNYFICALHFLYVLLLVMEMVQWRQ